jgi:hypothetical protein
MHSQNIFAELLSSPKEIAQPPKEIAQPPIEIAQPPKIDHIYFSEITILGTPIVKRPVF